MDAAGDDDGGGLGAAPLAVLGVLVAVGAAVGYRLTRRRSR